MSEEEQRTSGPEEPSEGGRGDSSEGSRSDGIKGGIRQGLGMLSAMKDAIEETLNEARERGDLTPERAKEVMRSALERAQEKAGEARDAIDFVKQKELEVVKKLVESLQTRVEDLEREVGLDVRDAGDATTEPEEGS